MGGKSKAPAAPNYTVLAKEQAENNLELAKYQIEANRANQITPYGTLTWEKPTNETASMAQSQLASLMKSAPQQYLSGGGGQQWGVGNYWGGQPIGGQANQGQGLNPEWQKWNSEVQRLTGLANQGGNGTWTQRITPTAEVQKLIDADLLMNQRYADLGADLFSKVQGAYDQGFGNFDMEQYRQEQLNRQLQRLQPTMDNQRAQLTTQLFNQGVRPGSEAYDNAMRNFTDEVNRLRLNADIGAGEEAARALSIANYQQDRPLSIVNALRTGSQPVMPTFSNYSQQGYVPGPDLLNAAQSQYDARLGAWNAQQASRGNFLGGLMGIAGSALGGPFGGAIGSAIGSAFR